MNITPKEELKAPDDASSLIEPTPRQITLLETWSKLMSNIEAADAEKITMHMAARITGTYPQIKMQEVEEYAHRYHAILIAVREILESEIASDPKALGKGEDDAELNHHHYLNLLTLWQRMIRGMELDWDSNAPDSHLDFAAIVDASNFVLGSNGLVAHLDEIGFDYDETDAADVLAGIIAE